MSVRSERLTLAVLICGVVSLALSDFVSPVYWSLSFLVALLRLWRGSDFHLSEMQASFIGWAGFIWVIAELFLGRDLVVAFTDFMLILAFAVVIEAPTARNHLHRMIVGIFLLLAAAVLTDSVLFVLPLTAMLWFLWRAAACLYAMHWPGGDLVPTPLQHDLRWMPVMVAVMAILFVLLPRFEFQSMLKATQPRAESTGFSDRVTLGDFARTLDNRVVLRIELSGEGGDDERLQQSLHGRYWRGVSLSRFDGSGWQRTVTGRKRALPVAGDVVMVAGDGLMVDVYREASDHAYVQVPQGLLSIRRMPEEGFMDDAGAIRFRQAPPRRLRLQMELGDAAVVPHMRAPNRWELDQSTVPEALFDWLKPYAAGSEDRRQVLQQVAEELKSWTYDLQVPVDAQHPVAAFLHNRRGHCELYATTFALAARALGFPARLVNGYYAGEWNEIGHFQMIRQKHAHSWVEVWLDGSWQQMDVTPASRWLMLDQRDWVVESVWESVKLSWYRYVLSFEEADRGEVLHTALQSLKRYSLQAVLIAVLLSGLYGLWQVRSKWTAFFIFARSSPAWPVLDRWLIRRGVSRATCQPLRAVGVPQGVDAGRWINFVRDWEAQAYGSGDIWHASELKRHLRALCRRC
ncbi:MAG: hypothetical protein AUJ57_00305 [Zetaproteobacteria bacterium CG1_02_53_45]|nr:MAG: hypothetical protein AUJ57_00305 [Zetaproteobacteria bacterium CG1_02_53_45]